MRPSDQRHAAQLDHIADELGDALVEKLCAAFGGRRIDIPTADRMTADRSLAKGLGVEDATRLATLLGSGYIAVPLGALAARREFNRRLREAIMAGGSSMRIARKLGCHERTVERNRALMRREGVID